MLSPRDFKARQDASEGSDHEPSELIEKRIGIAGMILLFLFLFLAKCACGGH